MNWKLIDKASGEEVHFPHECCTFRGEAATVIGGRVPHKPSSTGFIYLQTGGEYYPSVCNLEWVLK